MAEHNVLLTDNAYAQHRAYWTQQTKSLTEPFLLGGMKTGITRQAGRSAETLPLSAQAMNNLKSLSRGQSLEWFVLLVAGMSLTLSKYSGSQTLIIDTPLFEQGGIDATLLVRVPLIIQLNPDATIREVIIESSRVVTQAYQYQNFPLDVISAEAAANTHTNVLVRFAEIHLAAPQPEIEDYDIVVTVGRDQLEWNYSTAHTYPDFIHNLHQRLGQLLVQFSDTGMPVSELATLSESEHHQLVSMFNQTAFDYPAHCSVVTLFEQQVAVTPDKPAVCFKESTLSYAELNQRANQLAHYLRSCSGVAPNCFVALLLERSEWMLVAIWAVLKSGAAYLPIAPDTPALRQQQMLDDADVRWVLTDSRVTDANKPKQDEHRSLINIEDWFGRHAMKQPVSNPAVVNQPDDLIYVMFTSGSTGKPKGVMVEHRSVLRLVTTTNYSAVSEDDHLLQLSNYAFDGSTYDIFSAHLNGAALHVPGAELLLRIDDLCDYLRQQAINKMFITTALFNKVIDTDPRVIGQFDAIYFGGQDASLEHIRTALAHRKHPAAIVHVYGPTENTTFSSYYPIESIGEGDVSIPIGSAIGNSQLYILNQQLQPAALQVEGDIYVSGAGLARGYLNLPELTARVFIPHPFIAGAKLYKTGDRGYWREDGVVVFAGREDSQVKIRGFRVEPGEIENHLLRHRDIKQAFVIARVNDNANKELLAYVVSTAKAESIRAHLAETLPDYMIPAHFILLDSLPLNQNGKVNKAALPEFDPDQLELSADYVAAVSREEQLLTEVWQAVLGRSVIGIHDNYFALGGDSIKAIQIAARLHQQGLKVEVQDIFRDQTVALLARKIKVFTPGDTQGPVTGSVPLNPIQHWFFKHYQGCDRHHFNQSVLLESVQRLNVSALQQAFKALLQHHDALRMCFHLDGRVAKQENRQAEMAFSVAEVDLPMAESGQQMAQHIDSVHESINISTGPLLQSVVYHTESTDYLLIVIHHLVVDGISWRVIEEDLETAYRQADSHQTIHLPPKTDAFQYWSRQLSSYSQNPVLLAQRNYWLSVIDGAPQSLQRDMNADQPALEKHGAICSFALSGQETQDLLLNVNGAFRTEINDILLTALAKAFYAWNGRNKNLIALEGHGREAILENIDISRTVGWFTSLYPVCLELMVERDIGYQIKTIKDNLRKIPDKGIGFGVLNYLSAESYQVDADLMPSVSFNYLGQFDGGGDESGNESLWFVSDKYAGKNCSPEAPRLYDIEVTGIIKKGILSFDISYSDNHFHSESVLLFVKQYQNSLKELIKHCISVNGSEISPGDIDYDGLSIDELDDLLSAL